MPFAYSAAPAVLYRIGHLPDPFTRRPPRHGALKDDADPAAIHEGGRFDDPDGHLSTLYLASTPITAFAETIHNFRAVRGLKARILAATDEDDPDEEFDIDILSRASCPAPSPSHRATRRSAPSLPVASAATAPSSTSPSPLPTSSSTPPLAHVELHAALGATIAASANADLTAAS